MNDKINTNGIQVNLSNTEAEKLIKILLNYSKSNDDMTIGGLIEKKEDVLNSSNDVQSIKDSLRYIEKDLCDVIRCVMNDFNVFKEILKDEKENTSKEISLLNKKLLNIEKFIMGMNRRLNSMMITRLTSTGEKYSQESQTETNSSDEKQNLFENKKDTLMATFEKAEDKSIDDNVIPNLSVKNNIPTATSDNSSIYSGISTSGDDDYNDNVSKKEEECAVDDINTYPDFIDGNVPVSDSEFSSHLTGKTIYPESSENEDTDNDDHYSTRDNKNSSIQKLKNIDEKFNLNNNNLQKIKPENYNISKPMYIPEFYDELQNNDKSNEIKVRKLFDGFNKYIGTYKFYNANFITVCESKKLCTITHSEDYMPNYLNITSVSYKIVYNDKDGYCILIFEDNEVAKSKFMIKITGNLELFVVQDYQILCEYTNKKVKCQDGIRWTITFPDNVGAGEFWSVVEFFKNTNNISSEKIII